MKSTILLLTAAVAIQLSAAQQPPSDAERQFEAAIHKETVQGDLKGAIALYNRVIERYGKVRPVAAKALFQKGQCQEKLGQAEARTAYERVIKEYGDQADVVARARAKLAVRTERAAEARLHRIEPSAPGCMVQELGATLEVCVKGENTRTNGDIYIRNARSGQERLLAARPPGVDANITAGLSPDEKTLVYFRATRGQTSELRAVRTDGSGDRKLAQTSPAAWGAPIQRAWSRDGKWILAALPAAGQPDKAELVMLSVVDGTRRKLRDIKGSRSIRTTFSPDEKFVAFEEKGTGNADPVSILVMPVEGGEAVPVVRESPAIQLVGWHQDGRLFFVADWSGGSVDVWSVRMQGGRSAGQTEVVHSAVEPWRSWLWLDRTGSLRYDLFTSGTLEIWRAPLNSTSPPQIATKRFLTATWSADYSSDGRLLTYATAYAPGTVKFVVQDVKTGEERVYDSPLRSIGNVRWHPDGASLIVHGNRRGDDAALHRFVLATGEAHRLGRLSGTREFAVSERFAFVVADGAVRSIHLQTGEDREIFRPAAGDRFTALAASRDGSTIVVRAERSGRVRLDMFSTAGGEPKTLVESDQLNSNLALAADGKSLYYARPNDSKGNDLMVVPVAGGQPRKILATAPVYSIAVHPAASEVTWGTRKVNAEQFWVVDTSPRLGR